MSEVLAVRKLWRQLAFWVILDCGHWYKWTAAKPPLVGASLQCPWQCNGERK